jgi:hypothetical protein
MKKQKFSRLLSVIFIFMPVVFLMSCSGNATPHMSAVKIKPLNQNPYCEAGSIGEMCRDTKGCLWVRVMSNNNKYKTYIDYNSSSTFISGSGALVSVAGGAQMWEVLTIGNSTTDDVLVFSVPNKLSYELTLTYTEYGANNPSPSNANCANMVINGQNHCKIYGKMWSFKRGVHLSSSTTTFDPNNWLLQGAHTNCLFNI